MGLAAAKIFGGLGFGPRARQAPAAISWEIEALTANGYGAWALDLATGAVTTSALCRAHFGFGESESLCAEDFIKAVHPEDRTRFREAFDVGLPLGLEIDGDFRLIRGGGVRCLEMHGRPGAGAGIGTVMGGAPMRATGISRDVTERRNARDRLDVLVHQDRLNELGQMASGLAHELNQPLSAAQNYLSAGTRLIQHHAALERVGEAIAKAAAQLARTNDVIRRIRGLAEQPEAARTAEPMALLIGEPVQLLFLNGRHRDVHLEVAVPAGLPLAFVERAHVQQVVLNLVRNALEAMDASPKRKLTVGAMHAGAMIEVSVTDSGPGVAPEVAAHLFQPFVTTKMGGMGVGLSLCRAIVGAHGGEIGTRAAEGGGAVFWFTVPVAGA